MHRICSEKLFRCATLLVATLLSCFLTVDTSFAGLAGQTRVASSLASPIFATHAPGDRDRLFIVERGSPVNDDSQNASARIRILDLNTGAIEPTPFLTIPGLDIGGEGGLLGMTFHPDYAENGKFYVYATANDDVSGTPFSSYIREYTRSTDPNVANPDFTPILSFAQPQSNHNGGWIGFSPVDGYLYIASGDGGGGNDSGTGHTAGTGNAQDITDNLLGKMLRIDVDGDDFPGDTARNYTIPPDNPLVGETGDDEIWAYGLRNPFRDSFDRVTGDLWIGDVGQSAREEINFQPADSEGGENYGWRLREGLIATPGGGVGGACPTCVDPVYDYNRDNDPFGGTVVTGGYVYRGPDPSLQGQYFFLDSRNSSATGDDNYWMFDPEDPFRTVENIEANLTPDVGSGAFPVSFGEDAVGNLYIVYLSGSVYRINTDTLIAGDFNADGDVDAQDYEVWKASFGEVSTEDPLAADANGDGVVDAADYTVWRDNLGASARAMGEGTSGEGAAVPEPTSLVFAAQLASLALLAGHRVRHPARQIPR